MLDVTGTRKIMSECNVVKNSEKKQWPLHYLIVVLQHLSDNSYLRMIILYGNNSTNKRKKLLK